MHTLSLSYLKPECLFIHFLLDWSGSDRGMKTLHWNWDFNKFFLYLGGGECSGLPYVCGLVHCLPFSADYSFINNFATHPFAQVMLGCFQTLSPAHCHGRLTHHGWPLQALCPDLWLVSESGRPGRLAEGGPLLFPVSFLWVCLRMTRLTVTFPTDSLPLGPGNPSSATLSKLGEKAVLLSPTTKCHGWVLKTLPHLCK